MGRQSRLLSRSYDAKRFIDDGMKVLPASVMDSGANFGAPVNGGSGLSWRCAGTVILTPEGRYSFSVQYEPPPCGFIVLGHAATTRSLTGKSA